MLLEQPWLGKFLVAGYRTVFRGWAVNAVSSIGHLGNVKKGKIYQMSFSWSGVESN